MFGRLYADLYNRQTCACMQQIIIYLHQRLAFTFEKRGPAFFPPAHLANPNSAVAGAVKQFTDSLHKVHTASAPIHPQV